MQRTKNRLIAILFMSFIITMSFAAAGVAGAFTNPVIEPYGNMGIGLSVSYDDGNLDISVIDAETGAVYPESDIKFQFWIKTRVETDKGEGGVKEQYIWQIAGPFSTETQATVVNAGDEYLDEAGVYNVIARVQDKGNIVGELYGAFTPAEAGQPVIHAVNVNGKAVYDDYIIISRQGVVDIAVIANEGILSYSLYKGETLLATDADGLFENVSLKTLPLPVGTHTITAKAVSENGTAAKDVRVYVYDEYVIEGTPVIESLSGVTDSVTGISSFVMKVKFADGTPISEAQKETLNYTLKSEGKDCTLVSKVVNAGAGTLDVTFEYTHGTKPAGYGIYQMVGTVSRKSVSAADDRIIVYYNTYGRSASAGQSSVQSEYADPIDEKTYTKYEITAWGTVGGSPDNLQYAFYREDASGWVLMKNYSTEPTLEWIPVRAGEYNIQVRVKANGAGSYEAVSSQVYSVSGALGGGLNLTIHDFDNPTEAYEGSLEVGKPYKLKAELTESADALYMFTLSSANLGTVYLNKFTTSPYYIFIPNREDSFTITARAISADSYGFRDIYDDRQFESVIKENLFSYAETANWQTSSTNVTITYDSEERAARFAPADINGLPGRWFVAYYDVAKLKAAQQAGYSALKFNVKVNQTFVNNPVSGTYEAGLRIFGKKNAGLDGVGITNNPGAGVYVYGDITASQLSADGYMTYIVGFDSFFVSEDINYFAMVISGVSGSYVWLKNSGYIGEEEYAQYLQEQADLVVYAKNYTANPSNWTAFVGDYVSKGYDSGSGAVTVTLNANRPIEAYSSSYNLLYMDATDIYNTYNIYKDYGARYLKFSFKGDAAYMGSFGAVRLIGDTNSATAHTTYRMYYGENADAWYTGYISLDAFFTMPGYKGYLTFIVVGPLNSVIMFKDVKFATPQEYENYIEERNIITADDINFHDADYATNWQVTNPAVLTKAYDAEENSMRAALLDATGINGRHYVVYHSVNMLKEAYAAGFTTLSFKVKGNASFLGSTEGIRIFGKNKSGLDDTYIGTQPGYGIYQYADITDFSADTYTDVSINIADFLALDDGEALGINYIGFVVSGNAGSQVHFKDFVFHQAR